MKALLGRARPAGFVLAAGLAVASCSSSASTTAAAPATTATQAASPPGTSPGGTSPGGTSPGGTSPGGTSPGGTSTSTPASMSAADGSASSSAPAGGGGGECGTAHDAAGKALAANSDVTSFEIGAGCDVTISTAFTETGDPKAMALCDAVGKVAYPAGGKSVTVLGAADKEIAIGIKGQRCIRG